MPVYELDFNDFSSNEYALIAIHTTLSDYKLAYLLNNRLNYLFKRADFDLDMRSKHNEKVSFTIYEYFNTEYSFFLISNVYKNKKETDGVGLFIESIAYNYLVPEKKKVDYFMKIEGDIEEDFLITLIKEIKSLPQVLTSYEIEVETLKSKDFLIF